MGKARLSLHDNFNRNLVSVMKQRRIRPTDLARLCGNDNSDDWIRQIAHGRLRPKLETIERICEALKVDPIAMLEE